MTQAENSINTVEPCRPEDFEKVLDKIADEKGYSTYQELRDDYANSIGKINWRTFKKNKKSRRTKVANFRLYRDFTEDKSIVRAKYQEFGELCRDKLEDVGKDEGWLTKKIRCTSLILSAIFDGEIPCQKEFLRNVSEALGMTREEVEGEGFYLYDNDDEGLTKK
jgi:hypothetical protein